MELSKVCNTFGPAGPDGRGIGGGGEDLRGGGSGETYKTSASIIVFD